MKLWEKLFDIISDEDFQYYSLMGISASSILYFIMYLIRRRKKLIKKLEVVRLNNPGLISLMKTKYLSFNSKIIKKYSYPSGLINYANNCYINVLLQSLSCLPEFILYSKRENNSIIQQLNRVLSEINNSSNKSLSQESFFNMLTTEFKFANEQQDSYELYHRLLDLFNSSLSNLNPLEINLEVKYYCGLCRNTITKPQIEINLSIDSTDNTIKSIQNELTMFEKVSLINDYMCSSCTIMSLIRQLDENNYKSKILIEHLYSIKHKDDTLEGLVEDILSFCDINNCQELVKNLRFKPIKTTLQKTTKIKKTNENLIIHIAYIGFEGKSNSKIIFNESIIINEIKYELVAIIVHVGSSSFGHYFCYRKFYGLWVVANDSNIKLVNKETIFNSIMPYMLFYRKIQ